MNRLRQRMLQGMQIRNFALGRQPAYINAVAKCAKHFDPSPDQLGPEEIRAYQIYLKDEKKVAWSVFNTTISALRFFYGTTQGKGWSMDLVIPFPHHERRLPVVL